MGRAGDELGADRERRVTIESGSLYLRRTRDHPDLITRLVATCDRKIRW